MRALCGDKQFGVCGSLLPNPEDQTSLELGAAPSPNQGANLRGPPPLPLPDTESPERGIRLARGRGAGDFRLIWSDEIRERPG